MLRPRIRPSLVLLLAGMPSCVNEDLHFDEVRLLGNVTTDDPALDGQGELWLELHHGYLGEGVLRRPLGLIEGWQLETGERRLEDTVLVSTDGGAEGLVLYGWLDLDGDGVLCAAGTDVEEPAGVVVLDYPGFELDFELVLTDPCRGSEALYP